MSKRFVFLTLNVFSATGGIEKVCRIAGKALHELAGEKGGVVSVYSMYDADKSAESNYFPLSNFKGFGGSRLSFITSSALHSRGADVVLLSHINLLPVGYLIKKVSPKTKLMLLAHGIEVWDRFSGLKKKMLKAVDVFLPVSAYTGERLQEKHGIGAHNIKVLNNCLDPFLKKQADSAREDRLRKKYGLAENDLVLLTVTRLKFSEQYKGYDKVVQALSAVRQNHPSAKYLIVGKYDTEEKERLDAIIAKAGLADTVIFAGFASDDDLSAHFTIADLYIMPSTGEGFGIVFIEALFYGKPVIAGNLDGSVDALAGGEFGLLINPNSKEEIIEAVNKIAANKQAYIPDENRVMDKFGFPQYKQKLAKLLYD